MTDTKTTYDYQLLRRLQANRKARLDAAQQIVDRASTEGRDLTTAENDAVNTAMDAVKGIDVEIKDQQAAMMRAVLGSPRSDPEEEGTRFLSLRTPGVKSDLAARIGSKLGTPGMKALLSDPSESFTIPMDPTPYRQGEPPTALIEVLPTVVKPVRYRFMRQTTRTNNAAPVATGGTKPTSVFGLTPFDGELRVVAHLSEPIDKYQLQDGPSLAQFVQEEMVRGLHEAVEAQVVSGSGVAPNLTGLANTSGIQTQAWVTSMILTARAAVTKVEVLGFTPAYFILNPLDWEAIETSTLTAGQYVLNAEGGQRGAGLPVESAQRRLWGVQVVVTTAVAAGTGYLLSTDACQLVTDGQLVTETSTAHADQFAKNQVTLRVEGRFDLAVQRPMGVVQLDLTAV